MEVQEFDIPGVLMLRPQKFGDERGFFSETFNEKRFAEIGINGPFVQDNHSFSASKNVLRGLHFQSPPYAQGKLVRVLRGSVQDVAVDIRKGSPTFGRHVSVILSAENWNQIWLPKGFAHGFCTLEENTEFVYKVTDYYAPDHDLGIAWDDADLNIPWKLSDGGEPILSQKDQVQPAFKDLPDYFHYEAAPVA